MAFPLQTLSDVLALERRPVSYPGGRDSTLRDEAEQVDFSHILPRCPALLLRDCPFIMEFKYKIAFSL